jgi:hypothetical protein
MSALEEQVQEHINPIEWAVDVSYWPVSEASGCLSSAAVRTSAQRASAQQGKLCLRSQIRDGPRLGRFPPAKKLLQPLDDLT